MIKQILIPALMFHVLAQEQTYILSHFTFKDGDWNTVLSIHNGSIHDQDLNVIVYDKAGHRLGDTLWHIPADAALVDSLETLLPFSADVGWLEITASTDQLSGLAKFQFIDRGTSSLNLSQVVDKGLVFPLIENNEDWRSGFAVVNISSQEAIINIEIIRPDGTSAGSVTQSLGAHAKLVSMADAVFAMQPPEQSVIRIKSTQNVAGFALSFFEGNQQIVAVPGDAYNADIDLPDGMSPDAPIETLQLTFMLGEWNVEASWPIGGGVRNIGFGHVNCAFEDDGVTIRRDWDVAMNQGENVLGFDTHTYDVATQVWLAEWVPTNGDTAPIRSIRGNLEDGTYVEVNTGVDGFGQPYTARTRFFDVSEDGYEVQTDWQYSDGTIVPATWRASFRRVE